MKNETGNKERKSPDILANLNNPEMLEKLYRNDRKAFKSAFDSVYPEIEITETAQIWRARLEYDNKPETSKAITLSELVTVIAVCLFTAFLIKIPSIFRLGYTEEAFYMKNAAIIVFLGLSLYTIKLKRITAIRELILTGLAFLLPAIYMNLLPHDKISDSLELAYIHLPLLMWFVYGVVFTGFELKNMAKRTEYIRFNGDLAIVYALIAISGGLLTLITIGLFESIGMDIDELYMKNIVLPGAAAAPVIASYLIEKFPALVNRTASLIALIFSPLVLITLTVFLVTVIATGKDPYNDRDFLLIFNVMLIGVMGIIIFSVSGTSATKNQRFNSIILFALSIVTIIIDLIALSAIFYRLGQYGLTPNRLAVLVPNILVLANLILIMTGLFRINFRGKDFSIVETTVAKFMPAYLLWIAFVVFGFPAIFGIN